MKKCTMCHKTKPLGCFYKHSAYKDGRISWCKECYREYNKTRKGEVARTKKAYYEKNRDLILRKNLEYYLKNREHLLRKKKAWREQNKEWCRIYQNTRNQSLKSKLGNRISSGMRRSLRDGKGGRSWTALVGYDHNELLKRLNITMPSGYTWDDFLDGKLHIDHIIPVAVHNFEKPEDDDFKKCWSLGNLQLLPAAENISKGVKLDKSFQTSLVF